MDRSISDSKLVVRRSAAPIWLADRYSSSCGLSSSGSKVDAGPAPIPTPLSESGIVDPSPSWSGLLVVGSLKAYSWCLRRTGAPSMLGMHRYPALLPGDRKPQIPLSRTDCDHGVGDVLAWNAVLRPAESESQQPHEVRRPGHEVHGSSADSGARPAVAVAEPVED